MRQVSLRVRAGQLLVVLAAGLAPLLTPTAAHATDTLSAQMYRLRVCESSNNYRANTGNGYYGAYQFAVRTWRGLGFAGRPDRAAPRTQDLATVRLHARSGWRSWPYCARRMHLH